MAKQRAGRGWGLQAVGVLGLAALLGGCRSDRVPELERNTGAAGSAAAAKPEAFSFVLPGDYAPIELRGEGSEQIHVPPGTRLAPSGGGFALDAGPDFALSIQPSAPSLDKLKSNLGGFRPAFEGDDLLIVEQGGSYAFVVVRELVPEWDESDRRNLSCSSAGFEAGSGKSPRLFSRAAVDRMVAACRSLELPKLE
jgi:hypothetical protein